MDTQVEPITLPEGRYAIVEMMGHRSLVGRVREVEQLGVRIYEIEVIFAGRFVAEVTIGLQSIFQLTWCSPEVAFRSAGRNYWNLPPSIRAVLPVEALPAPEAADDDAELQPELPSFLHDAAGGAE